MGISTLSALLQLLVLFLTTLRTSSVMRCKNKNIGIRMNHCQFTVTFCNLQQSLPTINEVSGTVKLSSSLVLIGNDSTTVATNEITKVEITSFVVNV